MIEEPEHIGRTVRSTTGLTQKEFCEKYHIGLWALRGWEQGTREPDTHTRVYLSLIEAFPTLVAELVEEVCESTQSDCPQAPGVVDNL